MSGVHDACGHTGGCAICADDAIAMRVVETAPPLQGARCVTADGTAALVLLDLVDAEVGDQVLVHGGVAIARAAR